MSTLEFCKMRRQQQSQFSELKRRWTTFSGGKIGSPTPKRRKRRRWSGGRPSSSVGPVHGTGEAEMIRPCQPCQPLPRPFFRQFVLLLAIFACVFGAASQSGDIPATSSATKDGGKKASLPPTVIFGSCLGLLYFFPFRTSSPSLCRR
jgi:hypothetical protein